MLKKAAGVVIFTLMFFTLAGNAFAAGFSDLEGHWAAEQINKWSEQSLIAGYEDGTFKPDRQVTRAEFVALVNRAFTVDKEVSGLQFTDVKPDAWYYAEVAAATAAGYISGYPDATFGPDRSITRQEAAVILVKLLKLAPDGTGLDAFKDAGQIGDWAAGYVGAVVRDGLMVGMPDNTFQPQEGITRAQAVVALDRAREFTPPVKGAGIEGKVIYNNEAVSNALIRVFSPGGYEVLELAKTDINGIFKINLEPGRYDLTAATGKEVAYRSDIQVDDGIVTTVNLALQAAAVLNGILQDKDNKPVTNATLVFTTNPTFVTSTNSKGEYSVALVPDRDYRVRLVPGGEDSEPVEIEDNLKVGPAGEYNVSLTAETGAEQTAPGGGGGGGVTPPGTDNEPPVVESVTFMVDGRKVTVIGDNNNFIVDLTGSNYTDNSKFTGLTVKASADADKAEVNLLWVSFTADFNQGIASVSVNELTGYLGIKEISFGELKTFLNSLGTNVISITVTDKSDNSSNVTVTINV